MAGSFSRNTLVLFVATAILCGISTYCTAQAFERDEDRFTAKGTAFDFAAEDVVDEQVIFDPITENTSTKVIRRPVPTTINEKRIYTLNEVTSAPAFKLSNLSFEEYMLSNIKIPATLKAMPDGTLEIHLRNIIVDENGKIVYFNYGGFYLAAEGNKNHRPYTDDEFVAELEKLLANAPAMQPALLNGRKVPVRLTTKLTDYKVVVKNHSLAYSKLQLMDVR